MKKYYLITMACVLSLVLVFSVRATPKIKIPLASYNDPVLESYENYQKTFLDTDITTIEGKAAAELYRRQVIQGYLDNTFRGEELVNRAQAAKILLRTRYGDNLPAIKTGTNVQFVFSDVASNQWYSEVVIVASQLGIINGYPDGTFRPDGKINTVEFLKMLTKIFPDIPLDRPILYQDVDKKSWYGKYLGSIQAFDFFPKRRYSKQSPNLFPDKVLTRNEMVVAIYQYLRNRQEHSALLWSYLFEEGLETNVNSYRIYDDIILVHLTKAVWDDDACCLPIGDELVALDIETGQERWKINGKDNTIGEIEVVNKIVYVWEDKKLEAIDLLTGKIKWKITLDDKQKFLSTNGRADETTLYIIKAEEQSSSAKKATLWAIDITNGNKKWEFIFPLADLNKGIIDITPASILLEGDFIYSLDLQTGKEQWRVDIKSHVYPYILKNDVLYVFDLGSIKTFDTITGKQLWQSKYLGESSALFVATQTTLYAAAISYDRKTYKPIMSPLQAFDLQSGEMRWTYIGGISAKQPKNLPYINDEVIYFLKSDQEMIGLDAKSGKPRWSWLINNSSDLRIPLEKPDQNGLLYAITEQKRMVALEIKSGDIKWEYIAPDVMRDQFQLLDGVMYFSLRNGTDLAIDTLTGINHFQKGDLLKGITEFVVLNNTLYGISEKNIWKIDRQTGELTARVFVNTNINSDNDMLLDDQFFYFKGYNGIYSADLSATSPLLKTTQAQAESELEKLKKSQKLDQLAEQFFNYMLNKKEGADMVFIDEHGQTSQTSQTIDKEANQLLHSLLTRSDIYWVDDWKVQSGTTETSYMYKFERTYGFKNFDKSKGEITIMSPDGTTYYYYVRSGINDDYSYADSQMALVNGNPPKIDILEDEMQLALLVEGKKPFTVKQNDQTCQALDTTKFYDEELVEDSNTQAILSCPLREAKIYLLTIENTEGKMFVIIPLLGYQRPG